MKTINFKLIIIGIITLSIWIFIQKLWFYNNVMTLFTKVLPYINVMTLFIKVLPYIILEIIFFSISIIIFYKSIHIDDNILKLIYSILIFFIFFFILNLVWKYIFPIKSFIPECHKDKCSFSLFENI